MIKIALLISLLANVILIFNRITNRCSYCLGKMPDLSPDEKWGPDMVATPKQGRVIKAKTAPEYEPGQSNKGGRVVRHIPKQLKKMKEAQSEVPTVQD